MSAGKWQQQPVSPLKRVCKYFWLFLTLEHASLIVVVDDSFRASSSSGACERLCVCFALPYRDVLCRADGNSLHIFPSLLFFLLLLLETFLFPAYFSCWKIHMHAHTYNIDLFFCCFFSPQSTSTYCCRDRRSEATHAWRGKMLLQRGGEDETTTTRTAARSMPTSTPNFCF